jgi:hypothetical protein
MPQTVAKREKSLSALPDFPGFIVPENPGKLMNMVPRFGQDSMNLSTSTSINLGNLGISSFFKSWESSVLGW